VLISENQLKLVVSEQISTGVQSGTYKGTTSNQYKNHAPVKPIIPEKIVGDPNKWKAVKAKFNNNALAQATQWWKTWINNRTTKTKFANNWRLYYKDVETIFQKYNNILDKLKLEYVWDDASTAIAYVKGGRNIDKLFGITTDVIYVNVANAVEYPAVSVLIHEIQHILFKIKPFHPADRINTDIKIDYNNRGSFLNWAKNLLGDNKLSSKVPTGSTKTLPEAQKKLQQIGIRAEDIKYYWVRYNRLSDDDIEYLKDPTEVYSRLASLRELLKLKPEQNITAKEIVKATEMNIRYDNDGVMNDYDMPEPGIEWLIFTILASPLSVQQIINQWNSYAKSNNNTNAEPTNFA
jgi:hypothetical protein